MITYDDILKLKEGFDKAETDEPFLYAEKDELKVVGDANNTRVKKHDYKLTFETEDGKKVTKEYKDIHITPRKRVNVTRLLVNMLPYFRKANEQGEVKELTDLEMAQVVMGMGDEVYDTLYSLAVDVLGVPAELKDYIDPFSALAFGVKLIRDNPAVVKEAEMSFG